MKPLTIQASRTTKALVALAAFVGLGVATAGHVPWGERAAHAYIRGGVVAVGGRGGGYVAVSRTTWVPGVGVSRATAVGGRRILFDADPDPLLYSPPVVVAGRPGAIAGWTARGVRVGGIQAGPSTGAIYRFGPYVRAIPGGCASIFWQGSAAYRCGAQTYVYDVLDGSPAYYPVLD